MEPSPEDRSGEMIMNDGNEKSTEIVDLRTSKITKIPLEEVLKELRKDIGDELFF